MNLYQTLCITTISLLPFAAFAQQEPKIAYVDIDRVLGEAKAVQTKMESMTGQVERLQDEVTAKRRLVKSKEDDVKKQQDVLSESELSKKRAEIKKLNDDIKTMENKYRSDLQRMDETFFEPTIKRIGFAIQDVALERKFDLVLRGEAVLYGAKQVDISDDIIRRLNSEDASSTGSAAAAKKAAAKLDSDENTSTADATESASIKENVSQELAPARRQRPVDRQPE